MTATQPVIPSISGISALDVLHALEEILGTDMYRRARASLSDQLRDELDAITALSWVPNTTFGSVVDRLAEHARREPEALLDEAVRRAVDRTFKTVWRTFLRFTSDEALIKRTPMIYARSRNVGQLSARIVAPGQAELRLIDWPDISDRQMRSIGVGIEAVVGLSGRHDVRMSCVHTSEGARYELRWRP
jgi:hypothetical protein